jgi:hypothetical protein
MDILRHTKLPSTSLYEWCNSFSPLIRAFLRISQDDDLGAVEQHWVNKCITAQITDFEQAVLVQKANDKWRPITLADGVFDLDELKKDISAADAKFAGRKYKPTALILEYLIARASKQNVPAPSFHREITVRHQETRLGRQHQAAYEAIQCKEAAACLSH